MKLSYTYSELRRLVADKHNVDPANIEITGLPVLVGSVPSELTAVVAHIRGGNKIAAIKHLRTYVFPGYGLRESKDMVEFLAYDVMGQKRPDYLLR